MTGAELPRLAADQVALLATVDETGPVVVPVSAVLREGPYRLLIGLARRRASLARAIADPRGAVSLSGPRFSVCARGRLELAADPLPGATFMAALRFHAEAIWDARGPATEVDSGLAWRWTAPEAAVRHSQVLESLYALARER